MSTFQHTIADTGISTGTSLSSITFFMEALSFLNGLQAHVSVHTSYLCSFQDANSVFPLNPCL